jgi:hypothetical protein|nr:MAG TPA: Shikimate kinase I [Caudoviricetes sp.]
MYQMKIFLFSQPTNCGKSRSLKLIISGSGFFFIEKFTKKKGVSI